MACCIMDCEEVLLLLPLVLSALELGLIDACCCPWLAAICYRTLNRVALSY